MLSTFNYVLFKKQTCLRVSMVVKQAIAGDSLAIGFQYNDVRNVYIVLSKHRMALISFELI